MIKKNEKIFKSLDTQQEALNYGSMKDSVLEKFIICEGKVSSLPRTGSVSITAFC